MNLNNLSWIHWHHFLTNKKIWNSDSFQDDLQEIWLDLEDNFNLWFVINHKWSHWNLYSETMWKEFESILKKSKDKEDFIKLFNELKLKIIEAPSDYNLNVTY